MRAALGSIERLDKARYRISMEGDRTPEGKRTRKTKVVRGTREDAEIELAKMKLDAGKPIDRSMTVGFFWKAVYLPTLDHLKPRTRAGYVSDYTRLVEPRFGGDAIDELSPSYIERRLWEIESPGSQRAAFKMLRQIVNYAYGEQYTDNNPFLRHIRLRPKPRNRIRVFTMEQQAALMDALEGERIEPAILAMMRGGLRVEEACALYWEDLAFSDGRCYIDVSKAYLLVDNRPIEQDTPKTEDSSRIAVISGRAAERLLACRPELRSEGKTPLVENRKGVRMRPDVMRARYKAIVARAGLPTDVPMKNLRHTFASSLNSMQASNAVISRLLGHGNLSTAYDHYLAAEVAQFERMADALAATEGRNGLEGRSDGYTMLHGAPADNMDGTEKQAADLG